MNTFSREGGNSSKTVWLPPDKESTQKRKTLLPTGANSFLLELIPFKADALGSKFFPFSVRGVFGANSGIIFSRSP